MENTAKISKGCKIEKWMYVIAGDTTYLVLFFFMVLDKMLGTTMTGIRYPQMLKLFIWSLLIVYAAVKMWVRRKQAKREWPLAAAVILLAVLVWSQSGYMEMIGIAFLIVGARGIPFDKILKVYLITTVPVLVVTVLLSQIGLVENLVYHRGDIARAAFGFIYPTDFVAHIFFIVIAWCALRKERIRYVELGAIVLLAVLADVFCDARLNVICLLLTAVCFFVLKKWCQVKPTRNTEKAEHAVGLLIAAGIAVCAVIMVVFSYLYHPDSPFWETLNGFLTERLEYGKRGFEEFGVSLFGQKLPLNGYGATLEYIEDYFFLDSSYVRILLEYGVVLYGAVFAMLMVLAVRLQKKKQYFYLMALALVAIQCTIEHHFLEMAYNPFLYMIFADDFDFKYKEE